MRRRALLTLAAASLVACRRPLPTTRHYRLQLPDTPPSGEGARVAARCEHGGRPSIAVEELAVDAVYDDLRITYRRSEHRIERYEYHLWAAAPGRLVSDALRSGYAASGWFQHVAPDWDEHADALVRGRLVALEEVDRSATTWLAHVVLELELVDPDGQARWWSQRYAVWRPLPERSPAGLAAAVSEALGEVVQASAEALASEIVARGACGRAPQGPAHAASFGPPSLGTLRPAPPPRAAPGRP